MLINGSDGDFQEFYLQVLFECVSKDRPALLQGGYRFLVSVLWKTREDCLQPLRVILALGSLGSCPLVHVLCLFSPGIGGMTTHSLACLQSDDWKGMDYGGCGLFACTIEVLWTTIVLGPSFYVVPTSCSGSIEVHFIWARTFLVLPHRSLHVQFENILPYLAAYSDLNTGDRPTGPLNKRSFPDRNIACDGDPNSVYPVKQALPPASTLTKKVWEAALQAEKDEEAIKPRQFEDLHNLVQESSNTEFARLEELKRQIENFNSNRSSNSIPYPLSTVVDHGRMQLWVLQEHYLPPEKLERLFAVSIKFLTKNANLIKVI
ncbi:hypothetical protein RHMOL_Rhmol02G0172800 [Rhododendron molle]|nr:hypothetical protein RHMOL_Rhmol02G0172800 [Rhododendron molle]